MVINIKPIVFGNFKNLVFMYPKVADNTIKIVAIRK